MEITCILCPVGCRLQVALEDGKVTEVAGNGCKRGHGYALQECVAPRRMVTAVMAVENRKTPLSVKTRTLIPKTRIFDCMRQLSMLSLRAPVRMGDVVCADVCGTGVDVVATKTVE
ncbi:MAG: DUF1667 domain-containing protein [Candidatus Limiplasma sp.]|nr:DUF1667 domain-containing protein [Candidatus Limiplasma sp.]